MEHNRSSTENSSCLQRRLALREARIPQSPSRIIRFAEFLGLPARRRPIPECPFVDKPRLLFLHVPKSGGTSFDSFLSTFFELNEIQPVREQYAAYGWRLDRASPSRYLHLLNHWFQLQRWLADLHIITMFRHPVDRIISEYWYLRESTDYGLQFPEVAKGEQLRQHCTRECSLDEWVRIPFKKHGNGHVRNIYTSILSSCPVYFAHWGRATQRRLLSIAKQNLRDRLAYFGILERYEESKELFCRTFGLPRHYAIGHERCNVATRSSSRTPPDESTLAYLRAENAWDIELYDFARELFAERCGQFRGRDWNESLAKPVSWSTESTRPTAGRLQITSSQLRGSGLYREEQSPDGQTHRWTGALPLTTIDLGQRFPSGSHIELRLQIIAMAGQPAWDSLALTLNGQPANSLQLSYDGRSWFVDSTFALDASTQSPQGATLEVHGDLQIESSPHERRMLGVAIRCVSIAWQPVAINTSNRSNRAVA